MIHERPTRRERQEAGIARFLERERRRAKFTNTKGAERMMLFAASASVVAVLAVVFVITWCARH